MNVSIFVAAAIDVTVPRQRVSADWAGITRWQRRISYLLGVFCALSRYPHCCTSYQSKIRFWGHGSGLAEWCTWYTCLRIHGLDGFSTPKTP